MASKELSGTVYGQTCAGTNECSFVALDHELDIYNFMLVTLLLSQQTTVESANYDSESYNVLALVPVTIKNKVQPMHIANLVQQSIKV